MNAWLQDFGYAVRMLRKNAVLTVVMVASLAIGIGANTAIFNVVDALLLRPLPYPQPDRLANVWLHSPGLGIFRDWPSPGEYIDIQKENHSFEQMALAQSRTLVLTGREQPERIDALRTQSTLLHMLGAKPLPAVVAGGGCTRQTSCSRSQLPCLEKAVQLRSGDSRQEHHARREPLRRCWGAAARLHAQL